MTSLPDRVFDRDPQHQSQDLAASLTAALGDHPTDEALATAASIVERLAADGHASSALTGVLSAFGADVFGRVLLFHAEARTSLMGASEAMTFPRSLARLGLSTADLAWPAQVLHPAYTADAAEWPADERARFTGHVQRWCTEHGQDASSAQV